jgi:hypothetical protein
MAVGKFNFLSIPAEGRVAIKIRNPAVETVGCKPKPTAYEKYVLVRTAYFIVISFAASLTSVFLGRFNLNTPLT